MGCPGSMFLAKLLSDETPQPNFRVFSGQLEYNLASPMVKTIESAV